MSRVETDDLGSKKIPGNVYYGIHSLRAKENFPISGTHIHPEFIRSYLLLKKAAARANYHAKSIELRLANAIENAVDDLLKKNYLEHFIVDAYQAGAGTSQNMNVNEVIANRANEMLGEKLGKYLPIHPNDHVNMSQSTNDTYPTVIRLTTLVLSNQLLTELTHIQKTLELKAHEFQHVMKSGRTHLQDAVPISLGDEFSGYAQTVMDLTQLFKAAQDSLRVLGIGGSACGNGVSVPHGYRKFVIEELREIFREEHLTSSPNLFSAMQSQLPVMIYSNALRALALEFTRMINDWRLLTSGPMNGFREIYLPVVQPGSSIMGGKVNPSILEMANQVCFKVLGNDTGVAFSMQAGQLELNVMMPVIAQSVLESTQIMTTALNTLRRLCLEGIVANREQCQLYAEQTPQFIAALNPTLGHDKVASLVQQAQREGKSTLSLIREQKLLSEEQIRKIFKGFISDTLLKDG